MSGRDPLLEHAVEVTEEPQTVGYGMIPCEVCPQKVPIGVTIYVAKDAHGNDEVWAEPDIADLEAHMLGHAAT